MCIAINQSVTYNANFWALPPKGLGICILITNPNGCEASGVVTALWETRVWKMCAHTEPASWVYGWWGCAGPTLRRALYFGLMLLCHLKILNNFWTRSSAFSFFPELCKLCSQLSVQDFIVYYWICVFWHPWIAIVQKWFFYLFILDCKLQGPF